MKNHFEVPLSIREEEVRPGHKGSFTLELWLRVWGFFRAPALWSCG